MASDLISRAALLDILGSKNTAWEYGAAVRDMYEIVKAIPAVNAAPVVHSQWRQTDAYPHWLYCLKCYKKIVPNVEWIELYNIPTNYCPNCGARMDGGADG